MNKFRTNKIPVSTINRMVCKDFAFRLSSPAFRLFKDRNSKKIQAPPKTTEAPIFSEGEGN